MDFICWLASAKYGAEFVGNMLRYSGSGLIYTGKIWKAKCKVCPATRFGWTCLYRSRIRFLLAGKRVGVDPDGFVGGDLDINSVQIPFSPFCLFFGNSQNSWKSDALQILALVAVKWVMTLGNSSADGMICSAFLLVQTWKSQPPFHWAGCLAWAGNLEGCEPQWIQSGLLNLLLKGQGCVTC